jgi:hypothetical protein
MRTHIMITKKAVWGWGVMVALAVVSAQAGVEIRKDGGIYEIVNDGEPAGVFWNPKTAASDVKFVAMKGEEPKIFWNKSHRYLAANGGTARDRQLYLYLVDGKDWSSVETKSLSAGQLAPLKAIGKWEASGTEAVRWVRATTLLMRVWAKGTNGKTASILAVLEIDGDKAEVAETSAEEPAGETTAEETTEPDATAEARAEEPVESEDASSAAIERKRRDADEPAARSSTATIKAAQLVGEHPYTGKNPDGSAYRGTVAIRAKGGLLLFQWKVGDSATHGTGLLEGSTVGVALESGVAIYQAVPNNGGISLIGLWKTENGKEAADEVIFIGEAEQTDGKFAIRDIDGEWDFRREAGDDEAITGTVKISGGDVVKKLRWQLPSGRMAGEGLLLADGLAVITEEGLAVYSITGGRKERFAGRSVNGKSQIFEETLTPAAAE